MAETQATAEEGMERRPVGWLRMAGGAILLLACALWVASMAVVPSLSPYYVSVRGVYLTAVPLSAGFLLGTLLPPWTRRHMRPVLAGSAVILLAALVPRLRHDLPRLSLYPILLTGVCLAVAFVRLGMGLAGIGWGGHGYDSEEHPSRWWTAAFLAVAWAWIACALFAPRQSFPPTQWLLVVTGTRPGPEALAPSEVHVRRYTVSSDPITWERGVVNEGSYRFGVLAIRPSLGELNLGVTVRRQDGIPFGQPVWLTVDASDPDNPASDFPAELYDRGRFAAGPGTPPVDQLASARRLTGYATFQLTQSLPAVHLRARLWTALPGASPIVDLLPVAEADLGDWDLTPLRWLRPQPYRREG